MADIPSKYRLIFLPAILIVAAALYAPTLKYGLVWDDHQILLNEPVASGKLPWTKAFTRPVDRLYRPLRTITFVADRVLSGRPSAAHLTNLILFLLCCASFHAFILSLTGNRLISFFAAAMYAVHPANAEVVPWITGGRANLLSDMFVFICLTAWLKSRGQSGRHQAVISIVSFAAALFSKESAVIVPLLIVAIEIILPQEDRARPVAAVARALPFFAVLAGYLLLRILFTGYHGQLMRLHSSSAMEMASTMSGIFADYLGMLFVPAGFCPVYTVQSASGNISIAALLPAMVLIAAIIIGAVLVRRIPLVSLSIAWFFITLIPVSNIIPIASLKAVRFLSLPIAASCLIFALSLQFFLSSAGKKLLLNAAAAIIAALYFAALLHGAAGYRNIWKDNFTLWTAGTQCAPRSYIAYNNLGKACYDGGMAAEAESAIEKAAKLRPDFPDIRHNLAKLYADTGRPGKALSEFKTAMALDHHNPGIVADAAVLLVKMNRIQEAAALLDEKAADPGYEPDARKSFHDNAALLKARTSP